MAEEKHHEDDSKDESYAAKGGIRVRLMQFTWYCAAYRRENSRATS